MPESEIKDIRVAKVIRSINTDFEQEIDFNDLARSFNLSLSRLQHLFKAEIGMPFRKYLRLVRLKKAQYLLETTFLTVNEIVKLVGIKDCGHFVRDFEKQYGLSPSKYRKRHLSSKKNQFFNLE